ncbi:MAG: DUF2339 domain-containing protein [Bacteroidota bacterium]
MGESDDQLQQVRQKLYQLEIQQQQLAAELQRAKDALAQLSNASLAPAQPLPAEKKTPVVSEATPPRAENIEPPRPVARPQHKPFVLKAPLEEFIGTNLMNKIGIAVLVIGVGIGAKYAIDHDLISPLTRIILGYLCGVVLTVMALRLKKSYEAFGAVLLSGGMAVFYFITFAAYNFYELIPQAMAFVLMVAFTGFTVFASLQYNLQVVALFGLVGAYAVPLMLSDGSGKVVVLFSYVTIINLGILTLSFKKTWKALYYTSFALTWLIFSFWFIEQYTTDQHLWIALIFSTVIFSTFYTTFLAYKLLQGEPLSRWDIALMTTNAFLYYMWGYFAIADKPAGEVFLGLFTLFNAVLHFTAAITIFRKQTATRDTFFFVAGLVLVFLTMAVPVQLDGNWVTMIWAGEAALLFWIGRTKKFMGYERLSYVLVALTFSSLLHDWADFYTIRYNDDVIRQVPLFLNIQFFTSLWICASWAWMFWLNSKNPLPGDSSKPPVIQTLFQWGLPVLLLICAYFSIYKEVEFFWHQRYMASVVYVSQPGYENTHYDWDLNHFKHIWLLNYSALFLLALALANHKWLKRPLLQKFIIGISVLVLLSNIVNGLVEVNSLRQSYLSQQLAEFYFRDYRHLLIRYVWLACSLPLLVIIYRFTQQEDTEDKIKKVLMVFLHFVVVALLSSELINVLELSGINGSDKLALSILWGVYALALIVYGLMRNQKFLRITAIVLFGITLMKLFFYDLANMGTIAKTIVMIILGVLLLVASFLYNKFKPANHENK